jgi:hypothetical protein
LKEGGFSVYFTKAKRKDNFETVEGYSKKWKVFTRKKYRTYNKKLDKHLLNHRKWRIPNLLIQKVNKGGNWGDWCFKSKNLEGWWGQDFERSFFKDVT